MRILTTKIQEKFEKILSRFVEGVAFCNFGSHIGSHVNENEKKIVKIQNLKISKIRKSNFVIIFETKIQEKFQKIRERFVGASSVLQFLALVGSNVNENEKKIGKI